MPKRYRRKYFSYPEYLWRYATQFLRDETLSFEEAIVREEERLGDAAARLARSEVTTVRGYTQFSYKARGLYLQQLQRWHDYFPREQIMIIAFEKFIAKPQAVFESLLDFVGLPPFTLYDLRPENANPKKEEISAEARKYLREYFRPHNEALYEYLGCAFGWQ